MNKKLFMLGATFALMMVGCKGPVDPIDPFDEGITDVATIMETYRQAATKTSENKGVGTLKFWLDYGTEEIERENVSYDVATGRGYRFIEGERIIKYTPDEDREGVTKRVEHYYPNVADNYSNRDNYSYCAYGDLYDKIDDLRWSFLGYSPDYLFVAKDCPTIAAYGYAEIWDEEMNMMSLELTSSETSCVMYKRGEKHHVVFEGEFGLNYLEDDEPYTAKISYSGLVIIGEYFEYCDMDSSITYFEDGEMFYGVTQELYMEYDPSFNEEAYNNIEDYDPEQEYSSYSNISFDLRFNGATISNANFYEVGRAYTSDEIINSYINYSQINVEGLYLDKDFTKPLTEVPASRILDNFSREIYVKGSVLSEYASIAMNVSCCWRPPVLMRQDITDDEIAVLASLVNDWLNEKWTNSRIGFATKGEQYCLNDVIQYDTGAKYDLYLDDKPLTSMYLTATKDNYLITGTRVSFECDGWDFKYAMNINRLGFKTNDGYHNTPIYAFNGRQTFYFGAYVSGTFDRYDLSAAFYESNRILREGDELDLNNPIPESYYDVTFYNSNRDPIMGLSGEYKGIIYAVVIFNQNYPNQVGPHYFRTNF